MFDNCGFSVYNFFSEFLPVGRMLRRNRKRALEVPEVEIPNRGVLGMEPVMGVPTGKKKLDGISPLADEDLEKLVLGSQTEFFAALKDKSGLENKKDESDESSVSTLINGCSSARISEGVA